MVQFLLLCDEHAAATHFAVILSFDHALSMFACAHFALLCVCHVLVNVFVYECVNSTTIFAQK